MDPEAKAYAEVMAALEPLDEAARKRVARWVSERVGVTEGSERTTAAATGQGISAGAEDLAGFFSGASAGSDAQKVLVAAGWSYRIGKKEDFDSQSLNSELKNLGHGVPNVTRALNSLILHQPQLVIQTRKSGTTKQARKRYRITMEGLREVDRLRGLEED
jgi:hypothetical protein